MSDRALYRCNDCSSVYIITIIETKNDERPQYCITCGGSNIDKVEPQVE